MSQALVMIKYSPPFAGKLLNKLAAEFISLSKLYIYNILIYTARNANPISFKFVKPFEISNYNVLIYVVSCSNFSCFYFLKITCATPVTPAVSYTAHTDITNIYQAS